MNISNPKKYPAQALAIILIVIVIAVIIAVAVLSRVSEDTQEVAEEIESSASLELADSTLDAFAGQSTDDLIQNVNDNSSLCEEFDNSTGLDFAANGCTLRFDDTDNLDALGDVIGDATIDPFIAELSSSFANSCESQREGDSSLTVRLESADSQDSFTVRQDSTFAFAIDGSASCDVELDFSTDSSSDVGVIINHVYADESGGQVVSFKEYADTDLRNKCIAGSCNTNPFTGDWDNTGGSTYTAPRVLDGHQLYELRITPVNGNVTVTVVDSSCYALDGLLKVQATATCRGATRGKQFVLNNQKWAPSIFDYVIFNGSGEFKVEDNTQN